MLEATAPSHISRLAARSRSLSTANRTTARCACGPVYAFLQTSKSDKPFHERRTCLLNSPQSRNAFFLRPGPYVHKATRCYRIVDYQKGRSHKSRLLRYQEGSFRAHKSNFSNRTAEKYFLPSGSCRTGMTPGTRAGVAGTLRGTFSKINYGNTPTPFAFTIVAVPQQKPERPGLGALRPVFASAPYSRLATRSRTLNNS